MPRLGGAPEDLAWHVLQCGRLKSDIEHPSAARGRVRDATCVALYDNQVGHVRVATACSIGSAYVVTTYMRYEAKYTMGGLLSQPLRIETAERGRGRSWPLCRGELHTRSLPRPFWTPQSGPPPSTLVDGRTGAPELGRRRAEFVATPQVSLEMARLGGGRGECGRAGDPWEGCGGHFRSACMAAVSQNGAKVAAPGQHRLVDQRLAQRAGYREWRSSLARTLQRRASQHSVRRGGEEGFSALDAEALRRPCI